MAGKPESPIEPFKRALTAATRAISHDRDLQVSYGPEAPGLRGKRARLPVPGRDLPAAEVAQIRGLADAMALKLRHHDDSLHSRLLPQGGTARAVTHTLQRYYGTLKKDGTTASLRGEMLDFDGLNAVIGTPELLAAGRKYE